MFNAMRHELQKIGLSVNSKSHIGDIRNGFTFLNVKFRMSSTGKISKKLGKNTMRRELHRLNVLAKKVKPGKLSLKVLIQHIDSWFGSNVCKMSRGQIKMIKRTIVMLMSKSNAKLSV